MDDLVYLPVAVASKSLSTREVVLSFPDLVGAVRLLAEQNVAVLGWETWYLYGDGSTGHGGHGGHGGHRSDYPSRSPQERWPEFVQRVALYCLDTARQADAYLNANPDRPGVQVYFCLSITLEGEQV